MEIKKIICFCGAGLGTSLIMVMNVKKALKKLGITGIEVEHSTIDDIGSENAELYVCSFEILSNVEKAGKVIGLHNLVSLDEITSKLKEAFEAQ